MASSVISALTAAGASGTAVTGSTAAAAHAANVAKAGAGSEAAPFSSLMKDTVSSVQTLEEQAQSTIASMMSGTGADVHEAMIAAQKADMAFELALAVRTKAVQAYQAVMGMQF